MNTGVVSPTPLDLICHSHPPRRVNSSGNPEPAPYSIGGLIGDWTPAKPALVETGAGVTNVKGFMKNTGGVTLIESVLTIGILSAGLIGVLYVFSAGTKSSLVADQTTIASNLAREKLEQIAADRANNGYAATIAANYSDGQLTGAYSEFTRTVAIAEVDPDNDNATDDFLDALVGSGYARVTVTVSFTGASSVVLETLIANYP